MENTNDFSVKKENNRKKVFRDLLITSSFFSVLELISLIVVLVALFTMAFPERFFISDMNSRMIDMGEQITLVLIYLFGTLLGTSIVLDFIINPIIFYKSFYLTNNWFYQSQFKNRKLKWYNYLLLFLFLIVYLILPFFVDIYYWVLYYKNSDKYLNKSEINESKNLSWISGWISFKEFISKSNKIYLGFLAIFIPIAILIIVVPPVLVNFLATKKCYEDKTAINNFMTLSNNHENTIMFYFDRAQVTLWNSLLEIDYLINKNKSFVSEFPEFTSFLMSISLANVTNGSNPSIPGSYWYQTWMKDYDYQEPYKLPYEAPNSQLLMKQFWGNAFYSQAKMFVDNQTKDIHISSVPYFSYLDGKSYGEPNDLDAAIRDAGANPSCTTNEAIASVLDNYHGEDRLSNVVAFVNATKNYHFKNTNTGIYQGWYMHHTHQDYCYYDYKTKTYHATNQSENNFVKSMWYSIQNLKQVLELLKETPFYSLDGKVDGNVYDHTQIIVTSDHGYECINRKGISHEILNYLHFPESYINNFYSSEIYEPNFVFMYKPFKGTFPTKNKFTFDTTHLITSGDIQPTFEAGLKRYKYLQTHHSMEGFQMNSSFFKPNLPSNTPAIIREYVDDNIIVDPMNHLDDLYTKRHILFSSMWSWRYQADAKKYQIHRIWELKPDLNLNPETLFIPSNWNSTLIK